MALNTNVTTNNTATSGSVRGNDISATMQTYYDKKMLEEMKPKLLHAQFAQRRPIPRNGGKTIQFRKWTPFDAKLDSLTEGVAGDGQKMAMTSKTATVAQKGGYVAICDLLDMTALDPVINDAIEQMADQGALSLDTLIRNELTTSADATNVLYATGTERSAIAATNKLTSTLLRKAVRTLKKNKAPMFSDGGKPYYVAIVGPDTTFDLQDDTAWLDVSKYQDKEKIYSGEIGTIFGVKIIETTQAQVFEADSYINEAATNVLAVSTLTTISSAAYVSATPSIQVTATATQLGSAGIAALVGKEIVIAGQLRTITAAAPHATPSNGTILTLDSPLTGVANNATTINSITIYPAGGGIVANDIAATLVFGKDAYGTIDIAGSGAVKSVVHGRGSAGTADPLDQLSTVGWKVDAFAVKILMPEWLLRIEHGISA